MDLRVCRRLLGGGDQRGFVAAEMVAAIGLLLIPTIMLVASFVRWPEQQSAMRSAAAEAARDLATAPTPKELPAAAEARARRVASETADQYRPGSSTSIKDVKVEYVAADGGTVAANGRGAIVRVIVTYRLPVLSVPTYGSIGVDMDDSQSAEERVDDYRSIG